MSLADQLSGDFSASARANGSSYALAGKVTILLADEWGLKAAVRGNDLYDILITREEDDLLGECTCPYFESGYPCKHLWAAIVVADQKHFLTGDGSSTVGFISNYPDYEDEDFDDDEYEEPKYQVSPQAEKRRRGWKQQLGLFDEPAAPQLEHWPVGRRLAYVIDVAATLEGGFVILEALTQEVKKNGELSKLHQTRIPRYQIPQIPDPGDREIMAILDGTVESQYSHYTPVDNSDDSAPCRYRLRPPLLHFILPILCRTERFFLKTQTGIQPQPIRWDAGDPWQFFVRVRRSESNPDNYEVTGYLSRSNDRVDIAAPNLLLSQGIVFFQEVAAKLDHRKAFSWISALRAGHPITVPEKQIGEFLKETLSRPNTPALDLPDELRYEEVALRPQPCLTFQSSQPHTNPRAHLSFLYVEDGTAITFSWDDPLAAAYEAKVRRFFVRDMQSEAIAQQQLKVAGFKFVPRGYYEKQTKWEISPKHFPRAARELLAQDWRIEAEGKLFRNPGQMRIEISTGIDWFELHGSVDYGDVSVTLPELLAAVKRGSTMVLLSDGTYGMLPEEWLKKYSMFAEVGENNHDHLRYKKSQIGLLNALIAAQPEAKFDKTFASIQKEFLDFDGIKALRPPKTFHGTLRHYQEEGLGWMSFLRRFGFGGCLADDMGLGKTVTILALLEERRKLRQRAAGKGQTPLLPSLVVVPKSLVFNWKLEAARFTPKLRVLDHTGISRLKATEHFEDFDLVLTTYGTLRNDAVFFKDLRFDYIILDEAQAIKNADTASSKAARLLQGTHKLALSGTPVENHLGELWSLFEFLNPGMLGAARIFKMSGALARNPDEETRKLLAQALRPYILRRTKQQVLKELPPKTEQTIYCELEPEQRKLYDELREYYRGLLLHRIDAQGMNKSKIYVLEALLRLRQAACHTGLIDAKRLHEPAAKLETLMPQLTEVMAEGHKVLVFSQFTSFLAILRHRLEKEGLAYEYLDGQTVDRQTPVERFQNLPESKLFLISLKAGGLGLNLTAAEYVYLLDPWWNPVAEAQAVDRAHRIGQTRSVFAYRLIAQNTVEEKVLELQKTKRDLADAILNADNSLIRNLAREDLELLLS